jgi:hypothetical protein
MPRVELFEASRVSVFYSSRASLARLAGFSFVAHLKTAIILASIGVETFVLVVSGKEEIFLLYD